MEREWFYLRDGVQSGPFPQGHFDQLTLSGTVRPDTPVWTTGLATWVPFAALPATLPALETGTLIACSYCARLYSSEDIIQFTNRALCVQCKPIYLQQLKEGVAPVPLSLSAAGNRAGFWIRLGAKMIDLTMLWIFNTIVSLVVMLAAMGNAFANIQPQAGQNADAMMVRMLIVYAILMVVQIGSSAGYHTFMVGKYGATLGKMACNLKIVTQGGKPTYGRALGRYACEMVNWFTMGFGYLMVVFDNEKRGLHDRICNTWVVYS